MKESDIRKYAELMRELGLTGLEITEKDQVVRLERNVPAAPAGQAIAVDTPAPVHAAPQADDGLVTVRSPIVGIFYSSPAENAQPYVSVGDRVGKGQTLCIIEAMKLMNEIAAEEEGVIAEVCAANGQVVEYGTELFRIRRS